MDAIQIYFSCNSQTARGSRIIIYIIGSVKMPVQIKLTLG